MQTSIEASSALSKLNNKFDALLTELEEHRSEFRDNVSFADDNIVPEGPIWDRLVHIIRKSRKLASNDIEKLDLAIKVLDFIGLYVYAKDPFIFAKLVLKILLSVTDEGKKGDRFQDRFKQECHLSNHQDELNNRHELYDNDNRLVGHYFNGNNDFEIHLIAETTLKLSCLNTLTVQSLTIHGSEASVINNTNLNVKNDTRIYCKNFISQTQSKIVCEEMVVMSSTQIVLNGEIQTNSIQMDTQSFIVYQDAVIRSLANTTESAIITQFPLTSFNLTCRTANIEGGQISLDYFEMNVDQELHLPKNLEISARAIKLISANGNAVVRSKLIARAVKIDSVHRIKISRAAKIRGQQCMMSAENIEINGIISNCEQLNLHADLRVDIAAGSTIQCNAIYCKSDIAKFSGSITSLSQTEESVVFRADVKSLYLDGPISTNAPLLINSKKIFISSKARVSSRPSSVLNPKSVIHCKERILAEQNCQFDFNHPFSMICDELDWKGWLHSTDDINLMLNKKGAFAETSSIRSGRRITIEGRKCWNSGMIFADDDLRIVLDYYLINAISNINLIRKFKIGNFMAACSGKNIYITAGCFIGIFSKVQCNNSLQINTFLDFHIGLISGVNISRNNLIGIRLEINVNMTIIPIFQK